MGDFREVGIIRDPQPNDVLVVAVPQNAQVPDAAAIKQVLGEAVGCKIVVVSDGIRVGDDGAAAELAALKARRCDGCDCFMVADHAETGYGFCLLPNVDYRGAMTGPWGGRCPQVRPDHACNAWRPKP